VLVIIGVVIIAAGFVAGAVIWRVNGRRAETYKDVPLYECRQIPEVARDAPGMRVAIHASSVAGPDGALRGPASERECAWYRLVHRERVRHTERDSDGSRRTRTEEREVSREESDRPFLVDDGTGRVLVDPSGARMDDPVETHDRVESGGGTAGSVEVAGVRIGLGEGAIGLRVVEHILPLGVPVYVLGGAFDGPGGPRIGRPGKGMFVISTRSPGEIVRHARRMAMLGVALGAGLVVIGVGLVIGGVA
jgi:hypothetical protein